MKKLWIAAIFSLAFNFLSPNGGAVDKVDLGTKPELLKRMRLVTGVATVENIDLAKRRIMIRRSDGVLVTAKVDESVMDLDKLKVGDEIKVEYYESATYQLVKAKPSEIRKEETVKSSEATPPGKKPQLKGSLETKIIATIEEIDSQGRYVKLKGPEGEFSVPVRDPKNLKYLKVGDQVKITYAESLAVKVLKNK